MLKRFLAIAATLAAANVASAQLASMNRVLVTDQANGYAAIDFQIVMGSATDSWLAAQFFNSTAQNGASFRLVQEEPNSPTVPFTIPDRDGGTVDADEAFSSFLSKPVANQTAVKRFQTSTNAPESVLAGTYTAALIDQIGHLDFPPDAINDGGYLARIAINVPNGIDFADLYVAAAAAPGDTVLASGTFDWGTLSSQAGGASDPNPSPRESTPWVIAAVPEPTSLALLALGALAGLRRR